ncbi:MAG TPA: hypothetical protein VJ672_06445 [Gemmatimonadaceae bacterium]|nr:hypothetical protein [Gemmatimonadaceae bacterium]
MERLTSRAGVTFRELDERLIIETLSRLRDRINERFPGSGLGQVASELLTLAHEATADVAYLRRPHWGVRIAIGITIALIIVVIVAVVMTIRIEAPARVDGFPELIQLVESGINDLIFLGLAIFFLLGIEARIKRRRALAALHELRSLVHIVDMHQLTKDPDRLLSTEPDTTSSPERPMGAAELGRYLDYCSELLSLASKVAALFVQHFNDSVVLAAVDEIETLASGFSSKIWQKITMLERSTRAAAAK